MSKHSCGIIHLALITFIGIILIGIVGIVVYQSTPLKKFLPSQYQRFAPLPSPTPESQSDISEWKTYRNEEYRFETKYDPVSSPELVEGTETVGQFSYLLLVRFGTVPLKSPHGYSVDISKKDLESYRTDLLGHTTDKIDSEEEVIINGNKWTKLNYQIFITTVYAPITTTVVNHGGYSYAITASSLDIDQILSTFQFTN